MRWLLVLAMAIVAGCSAGDPICVLGFGPTIELELRDAAGTPAALGASGTATYESGTDSLYPGDSLTVLVWTNRAGTYSLNVARSGFRQWDTTGVVVQSTGGQCPRVIGVTVRATLHEAP